MNYDIVIVGAGPAGLSAALYASRAGAKVLILDCGAPGGKLNVSAEIENWPGTKMKAGPELAYEMYEHALSFGATHAFGQCKSISKKDEIFEVTTDDETYVCKSVIIASGTLERKLGLVREEDLTGRGVSYCAVCDGPFFKDEEVAVIGGGNAALEEALYLTKFASKVHLIVRRDVFRADQVVQDKLVNNEDVVVHFLKKPKEFIVTGDKVGGLIIEDSMTGECSTLDVKGIFPYVGMDPITSFASSLDIIDTFGYILTNDKMETSVAGLYAAGDVRKKALRQVVTASGDGAIAGQESSAYVMDK